MATPQQVATAARSFTHQQKVYIMIESISSFLLLFFHQSHLFALGLQFHLTFRVWSSSIPVSLAIDFASPTINKHLEISVVLEWLAKQNIVSSGLVTTSSLHTLTMYDHHREHHRHDREHHTDRGSTSLLSMTLSMVLELQTLAIAIAIFETGACYNPTTTTWGNDVCHTPMSSTLQMRFVHTFYCIVITKPGRVLCTPGPGLRMADA